MRHGRYSGSNELGLHLIITKISDVLKEADVLEGSINRGDEWIVLPPRSPWCLTAILVRKRYCSERKHDNNSVLSIRPVPFTESGKKCYFQSFWSSEVVTCITMEKEKWNQQHSSKWSTEEVSDRRPRRVKFLSLLVAIADIDHCWSQWKWFLVLAEIEIFQETGLRESNWIIFEKV